MERTQCGVCGAEDCRWCGNCHADGSRCTEAPEIIGQVYLVTYSHQPYTDPVPCAGGCGLQMTTRTHGHGGEPVYEDTDGKLYCGPCVGR